MNKMVFMVLLTFFSLTQKKAKGQEKDFISFSELQWRLKFEHIKSSTFFERKEILDPHHLKSTIEARSLEEQNKIKIYINQLDRLMPKDFLLAAVYWKYIKPSESNYNMVFRMWGLLKLNFLSELSKRPLQGEKTKKLAKGLLRKLLSKNQLPEHLFPLLLDSYNQKIPINLKTSAMDVYRYLHAKPLYSLSLSNHFPGLHIFSNDLIGHIPGNKITRIQHETFDDIYKQHLFKANINIIINDRILSPKQVKILNSLTSGYKNNLKINYVSQFKNMDFLSNIIVASDVDTAQAKIIYSPRHGEQSTSKESFNFKSSYLLEGPIVNFLFMDLNGLSKLDPNVNLKNIEYQGRHSIVPRTNTDYLKQHLTKRFRPIESLIIEQLATAKYQIYIKQRYLLSEKLISLLIKKKIQYPNIDIKILIEDNLDHGLNGLPNTAYMEELFNHDIKIKAMGSDSQDSNSPHLKNEFVVIDGRIIILGPGGLHAPLRPGKRPELTIKFTSIKEAELLNREFISIWQDPQICKIINIEDFKAKLSGKTLGKDTSRLLNYLFRAILQIDPL